MRLRTRCWGAAGGRALVCVHGVGQHGGVYEALGQQLAGEGFRVTAVDLRGHGDSDREPPWDTATHVDDLLASADELRIGAATWAGHSFGGRLVAALAARAPERAERLILLDPGFEVAPEHALRSAEMERLDWSFATVDGAVNALLSSDSVVAAPRQVVADHVAGDIRRGADGRFRFRHSPSAAVVAWSEVALAPPPVAKLPTLLVRPVTSAVHSRAQDSRYRAELGSLLTMAAVPNGHNVLWEAPVETAAAVSRFLATG